ncbi:MAG: hypothetical protein M1327_01875 [Candidatus Thermoplasmatota archaeon]|nr:hypothetical protein [Candidatus Thermoplasmatota archaeon]
MSESFIFVEKEGIEYRRKFLMNDNWQVINSSELQDKPENHSLPGYDTRDWNHCDMPQTSLGSLVSSGKAKDPFFGDNLLKLAGMVYKTRGLFCNEEMPESSPYRNSWYFRKEFKLDRTDQSKKVWLCFNGINYSANLWINGKLVKEKHEFKGTFRRFSFDITDKITFSEENVVELEIFPPSPLDLSISWADWNPYPPDKNMGIWQDVYILVTGNIRLDSAVAFPTLSESMDEATLEVRVFASNAGLSPVKFNLLARIEGAGFQIRIEKTVTLDAKERKEIALDKSEFSELILREPRLWWPSQFGEPYLYKMSISAIDSEGISDVEVINFGINEIKSELNSEGNLLLKVNRKPVLVLGAEWTPELFLRRDDKKLEDQILLAKDIGLNTIRLEGKLDSDYLFELTDRHGILVIAGWNCGDVWEKWDKWDGDNVNVAVRSLEDQLLRLRMHPSVAIWMNGSDFHPPAEIESKYLDIEKKVGWNKPIVSSATSAASSISGPTGVKMPGPYDYVPPHYWYEATDLGGAKGFITETCPGVSLPLSEEIRRFIPEDKLWPPNNVWDLHCGLNEFHDISRFRYAIANRFGEPVGLDDFLWKSQVAMYETERAMFEAYVRNRYYSTGVIHWMLNSSWPNFIWHLYSYYLIGNSSYFAVKKALERLHVQFCYDDNSVIVVNRTNTRYHDLKVEAKIITTGSATIDTIVSNIDVNEDSNAEAFRIDRKKYIEEVVFVNLLLKDRFGVVISRNLYWLAMNNDVLDYPETQFFHTPVKDFADLTKLTSLQRINIDASYITEIHGDCTAMSINLKNNSKGLGLLTRVRLLDRENLMELSPVYYSDNYITMLPGDLVTVTAKFETGLISSSGLSMAIDGFNVNEIQM